MRLGFERISGKPDRSAGLDAAAVVVAAAAATTGVEENVPAAGTALLLDFCSSRKVTLE